VQATSLSMPMSAPCHPTALTAWGGGCFLHGTMHGRGGQFFLDFARATFRASWRCFADLMHGSEFFSA